ncbi:MAG: glycosyltransferase family 9 protein [Deltaproteobacteria bacterium]|jgi:heptosyltransferase-2|nr:glycosyltransferase family 9 protein [Deltaproteobacteria bacterium]
MKHEANARPGAARLGSFYYEQRISLSEKMRIAVWNTAFLGDAVLTLPLLQTLRRAYPQSRLDFYVRRGVEGLFQNHKALSGVYPYDKRGTGGGFKAALAYGAELRARGYDLWVSAHQSPRSAFMAWQSRAKERVGYSSPWVNRLFYTKVTERMFPRLHEVDRLLRLAARLGLKDFSTWPEVELAPSVRERTGIFFSALRDRPLLGLHPGSVWGSKRWPTEYFASLALLALKAGARVMLFAGAGEEDYAANTLERIQAQTPEKKLWRPTPSSTTDPNRKTALGEDARPAAAEADVLDMSARLDLVELAACIAELDCYVSNDSGPMHLAWAQRTPVVAMFGPTIAGLGFAPRGESSVVMEVRGIACRPCGLHGPVTCPQGHHRCMRDLLPDMVWPEVQRRLLDSGLIN